MGHQTVLEKCQAGRHTLYCDSVTVWNSWSKTASAVKSGASPPTSGSCTEKQALCKTGHRAQHCAFPCRRGGIDAFIDAALLASLQQSLDHTLAWAIADNDMVQLHTL